MQQVQAYCLVFPMQSMACQGKTLFGLHIVAASNDCPAQPHSPFNPYLSYIWKLLVDGSKYGLQVMLHLVARMACRPVH